MIYEFGFSNFASFKEDCVISFETKNSANKNFYNVNGISTIVGITGANASGKTNILKALQFVCRFCSDSFGNKPDELIRVDPFFESNDLVSFYLVFDIDSILFKYELKLQNGMVQSEMISKKIKRFTPFLSRVQNVITKSSKTVPEYQFIKLRSNASIVSTAAQFNISEMLRIKNYFNMMLSNVHYGGYVDTIVDIPLTSKILHDAKDYADFVSEFIKNCDTGIDRIEIHSHDKSGSKTFFPIFYHTHNNSDNIVTQYTESSGTKKLFSYLPLLKMVLDDGGIAILDEFGDTLHTEIILKLLDLFASKETNPFNAQLLFATHNHFVLDYLTKYRLYIVNKEENESFSYRLDELPGELVRNDRSILSLYNDNKIGGRPNL